MIIYFCDRELNILGQASTNLPAGNRISADKLVEDVETGVNSFECFITWDDNTRYELESAIVAGNYILKQSDTAYDSLFQIIETEADTKAQEISIYAEDAGLDLLNTLCPATTLTGTIEEMLEYFLPDDWAVNVEDAPVSTLTNEWDGESTCTERIRSVVGLWDCELYYSFVIEGLEVVSKVVNVTVKRGLQEAIPQLRLNYDVDRIVTKTSIADLVTALNVRGGTPEGSDVPIDLVGYNYSYTDPVTGDVYQVDTATGQMCNISAMDRWSSVIDTDGLWVGSYSYDTTDKAILAGQARAALQRQSAPAVNYEVDFATLPEDAQIGDRVNIIDDDGELYLDARLLQIETSEAAGTKKATIGEYLLKSAGITEKVLDLAQQVREQSEADARTKEQIQILTESVDNMLTLEVTSNIIQGQAFLKAKLLNGNNDVTEEHSPALYKWILRKDTGERLLGRGYTLNVDLATMGYAGTILCRFIRPELYDLTDHNLTVITDEDGNAIQVSYAGLYSQPAVQRASRLKALRKASFTATVQTEETGYATLSREVNLYERGNLDNELKSTLQYFWTEQNGTDAGAHITEVTREEFEADPENGGGNLLARSNGIAIRDGLTELSSFTSEAVTVGNSNSPHVQISKRSIEMRTNVRDTVFAARLLNDDEGLYRLGITFHPVNISAEGHADSAWHLLEIVSATYTNGTEAIVQLDADGQGFTVSPIENYDLYIVAITDTPAPYFTLGRRKTGALYGLFSAAIGCDNFVEGAYAVGAGGRDNTITRTAQHSAIVGGYDNTATGQSAAIVGGIEAQADGRISMAHGWGVSAQGDCQTVIGKFNNPQGTPGTTYRTDYAFIIGSGTEDSARSNAMTVAWNGNTTIAGTLTQSSDRRLKEHVAYLGDEAIDFIDQLQPAHFIKDGEHHTGFYAQDVENADKWHSMVGEMNGFKTLAYTDLIAPLVKYCQSLEKRIEELEGK